MKTRLTFILATSVIVLSACGDGSDMLEPSESVATATQGPGSFSTGILSNFTKDTMARSEVDQMNLVEPDGDGWTAVVNGETYVFPASTFKNPEVDACNWDVYCVNIENNYRARLWRHQGRFPEGSRWLHADIFAFELDNSNDPAEDDDRISNLVYIVQGPPTQTMPMLGAASYEGRFFLNAYSDDRAIEWWNTDDRTRYVGDVTLTASFDDQAVSGSLHTFEGQFPGNVAEALTGSVSFEADITDTTFAANQIELSDSPLAEYQDPSLEGGFFGPDAANFGGIFEASNPTDNLILQGYIVGGEYTE